MENKNPIISVIVPVYNGENYISRCIESILLQTFTDFELILINDGSKDSSGKICEKYASKDKRIRVFHKKNGGVSSARNLGIDNALGKWLTFIDCDDEVSKTYIQDMFLEHISQNTLIFSLYSNYGHSIRHLQSGFYAKDEMIKYIINNKLLNLSGPYAKLYSREIINLYSIRFPIGINMGEDGIFIIKYLNSIDNLVVVDKSNYIVHTIEGSISSKYYSFESEWKCYTLWKSEIYKFITKYGTLFEDVLKIVWENRIGETFMRCLRCSYMLAGLKLRDRLKYLHTIPKNDYIEYIKYFNPISKMDKIQFFLIKNNLLYLFILFGKILKYKKKLDTF